MIVVEGPDNVGKTTLCKALVKTLNSAGYPHVYQHLSKLPKSFDRVHGYVRLMSVHTVWDRFYMSRNAYGDVLHNQETLSASEYELLDAYLAQHAGFTILITATDDWLMKQWGCNPDKEEMYSLSDVRLVNRAYRAIRKRWNPPRIHYELCLGVDEPAWPIDDLEEIVFSYTKHLSEISKHLCLDKER